MAEESFYLVEIDSGKVLKRWPSGHMSRREKAELWDRVRREFRIDDPEIGLDLRNTATDTRAPWD